MTRILLGVGGAALAVQGLRQHSAAGTLLAGLGGTIACLALTGERDLTAARCWVYQVLRRSPWGHDDAVMEASAESFPASDPPSWTPTVSSTGVRRDRSAH